MGDETIRAISEHDRPRETGWLLARLRETSIDLRHYRNKAVALGLPEVVAEVGTAVIRIRLAIEEIETAALSGTPIEFGAESTAPITP